MKPRHDDGSVVFVTGAIAETLMADLISPSDWDETTGAQAVFVGRVRADVHDGQPVTMLEYEAYREMAVPLLGGILSEICATTNLISLRVRHSLGAVRVGEVCFLVVATSSHRGAAFTGCQAVVERVKKEVPIFAKEHLADGNHKWKRNE